MRESVVWLLPTSPITFYTEVFYALDTPHSLPAISNASSLPGQCTLKTLLSIMFSRKSSVSISLPSYAALTSNPQTSVAYNNKGLFMSCVARSSWISADRFQFFFITGPRLNEQPHIWDIPVSWQRGRERWQEYIMALRVSAPKWHTIPAFTFHCQVKSQAQPDFNGVEKSTSCLRKT